MVTIDCTIPSEHPLAPDWSRFQNVRLEFGGGGIPTPGYLNCDLAEGEGIAFKVDLSGRLPFPPGWADEILAVHVLEHMPWTHVQEIFQEWTRVLKRGGLMIIEVPNMDNVFRGVLDGSWHLQFNNDNRGGNAMVPIWGEVSASNFMQHKAGLTPQLLRELYLSSGYGNLQWTDNLGVPITEGQLGWAMRLRGEKQ